MSILAEIVGILVETDGTISYRELRCGDVFSRPASHMYAVKNDKGYMWFSGKQVNRRDEIFSSGDRVVRYVADPLAVPQGPLVIKRESPMVGVAKNDVKEGMMASLHEVDSFGGRRSMGIRIQYLIATIPDYEELWCTLSSEGLLPRYEAYYMRRS